jgi:hypothetical protein
LENTLALTNPTTYPQTGPETYPLNDAPYLIENWKVILAEQSRRLSRNSVLIRVKDQVANVSVTGSLLIRTPLDIPDGFYKLTPFNELVRSRPLDWEHYLDPDAMMPAFAGLTVSEAIPRQSIAELRNYVQAVRDGEYGGYQHSVIAIDDKAFCAKNNPAAFFQIPASTQGMMVRLPITAVYDGPVLVKSSYLQLALTDAMRYDQVYIACENRPGQINPIFFFGKKSWDACAMVMPTPY